MLFQYALCYTYPLKCKLKDVKSLAEVIIGQIALASDPFASPEFKSLPCFEWIFASWFCFCVLNLAVMF